ncbi:MAG: hypothetical protein SGPRY_010096 [Prymnesium sp.]
MACDAQGAYTLASCCAHSFATNTLRLGYHSASQKSSREGARGMYAALYKIWEEGGHVNASYRNVTSSHSDAIRKALELMGDECVHAVIGGGMSSISAIAQSTFALANIPQVAYSSSADKLSDPDEYHTFSRVVPADDEQSKALVAICKEFSWRYVAVVSTQEVYGQGLAASFKVAFSQNGGTVLLDRSLETFSSRLGSESVKESVKAIIESKARIVALFVNSVQSALDFLQTASDDGLNAAYLACDSWIIPPVDNPLFHLNYVGVEPTLLRQGEAYNTFVSHWKKAPPINHSDLACKCDLACECEEPTRAGWSKKASFTRSANEVFQPSLCDDVAGMYAYDATLLVYRAWNLSLEEGTMPYNLSNGSFLRYIRSAELSDGVTSSISLNKDGELVNSKYDTVNWHGTRRFCGAEKYIPLDGSQPSSDTSRVIPGLWQKVDAGTITTAVIELRDAFSSSLYVQDEDCRRIDVNVLSNDEPTTVLSRNGSLVESSNSTRYCEIELMAPPLRGEYFLQIYYNNSMLSKELSAGLSVNGPSEWESTALSIIIVLACVFSLCFLCMFIMWRFQRARNSGPSVAENGDRELIALFCNPRMDAAEERRYGIRPLALGLELKHLLRLMPSHLFEIEPAATLLDAQNACQRYRPRILSFSGHTFAGKLAFEDDNGRLDRHADPERFAQLITGQLTTGDQSTTPSADPNGSVSGEGSSSRDAMSRLECVILSGCKTLPIAKSLLSAAPSLTIICWQTLAEDSATRSFTKGVYESIVRQLQRKSNPTPLQQLLGCQDDQSFDLVQAFYAGCKTFTDDGFSIGDPELFLHTRPHPHFDAPRLSTCQGCIPPVHGIPMLLKGENGEVHTFL